MFYCHLLYDIIISFDLQLSSTNFTYLFSVVKELSTKNAVVGKYKSFVAHIFRNSPVSNIKKNCKSLDLHTADGDFSLFVFMLCCVLLYVRFEYVREL